MTVITKGPKFLPLVALLTIPVAGTVSAQELDPYQSEATASSQITVNGVLPDDLSALPEGPEIEGFISTRNGNVVRVTGEDGTTTDFTVGKATVIKSRGGFLGLDRDELGMDQLLNGLPVSVETVAWGEGLAASKIDLKSKDLKMASMIHAGTAQGFAEQTAATEALRGRVADIDKYNVKSTTNVNFDTGMANLSPEAQADLCAAAASAKQMDNALLLVVGYTDSTGSYELNQQLSEKRATRVVNFLQQQCDWEPYRMLTPTGMAEADPLADNETEFGKAQNRRVAVNVLVSKSVDGI